MKLTVLSTPSRFFLAALFLFAAGAKLFVRTESPENFFANVQLLFGDSWGLPLAVGVIAAELIVSLLLLWKPSSRAGAAGAALLLLGFAAYALYYRFGLGHVKGLECGCFGGIISSQLGVTTALRNLVLLVPALLVLRGAPRERTADDPINEHAFSFRTPYNCHVDSALGVRTPAGGVW